MLKTKITCPLGSECESIKGDTIERCAWYVAMKGENPQTGEVIDEKACAMHWIPILLVDNSRNQKSTAAAVEGLRNEVAGSMPTAEQTFDALTQAITSQRTRIRVGTTLPG